MAKKLLTYAAKNYSMWRFLNATLIRAANYVKIGRRTTDTLYHSFVKNAIRKITPDLVVQHGPFKGMKYPNSTIPGFLFQGILGSYESEIHSAIEEICAQEYTEIINVGCGEGYYAVGFARRIPRAKIFAYDINEYALRVCKEMAQLNNVFERLVVDSFCDAGTLRLIPLTERALIFSDCEGYEKKLFTNENVEIFSHHDLLIEIHDFVDMEISTYIQNLFTKTHKIKIFKSISDSDKAKYYNYKELEGFDLATRKLLLGEGRPTIMEWFYLKPHSSSCHPSK